MLVFSKLIVNDMRIEQLGDLFKNTAKNLELLIVSSKAENLFTVIVSCRRVFLDTNDNEITLLKTILTNLGITLKDVKTLKAI